MVDLFRYQHWDLVSKRGIYYLLSGLLIAFGLFSLLTKGLNLGIDFRGGGQVTYSVPGTLPNHDKIINDIRTELNKSSIEGLKGAEVRISTGQNSEQVEVRSLLPEDKTAEALHIRQIAEAITPAVTEVIKRAGKVAPSKYDNREIVTGTISDELATQGVVALIIGSLLIMLWIWVRYNIAGSGFRYSLGGILALLHDLLILVGMFAIFRDYLQVNSPFIAALLTVLGYSIHDTIIIYDRIRENIRLRKGRTFAETVNISLLETMARSVNTILTVLFSLLALFFFGGQTLRDFVVAMLIGVIFGGYSSIFIASQLLVSWSKGKDRIILPAGEMPGVAPAMATATAVPGSAIPTITTAPVAPTAQTSREAIQKARQAGKTSKRNR